LHGRTSQQQQQSHPTSNRRRTLSSLICCCWRKKTPGNSRKSDALDSSATSGIQPHLQNPNATLQNPAPSSNQSLHASTGITSSTSSPPEISATLLPPSSGEGGVKIVMVIDLDETLVHSSFKPIENPDFIVPVEIDGQVHSVYVLKRPYVDEFLRKMGQLYECVLFTASLSKYADPVADLLDQWGVFKTRLFREACVYHRGNYVKDLNRLGRDLKKIIIIDNSPASYIFHPDNAVPVASWFDDTSDTELLYLIPFFERLATVENVYTVLRNSNHPFNLQSGSGGDKLTSANNRL